MTVGDKCNAWADPVRDGKAVQARPTSTFRASTNPTQSLVLQVSELQLCHEIYRAALSTMQVAK